MSGKRPAAEPEPHQVLLHVLRNGQTLATRPVVRPPMVVGSAAGAGLRIRSRALADEHAAFDIDEHGQVVVLNLGGPGCVQIGGQPVEHAELNDGDVVDLGPVQIRVEVRALSPAPPVPEAPAEPAPAHPPTVDPRVAARGRAPTVPDLEPPQARKEPDVGPFLLLTSDDGGEDCFELPVGRTTVGSGPCAIRVHDPHVPAIKGEWFRTPDRTVYYQAHPRGAVVRCEEWRSEAAGPVTIRLVYTNRVAARLEGGDGPASAKRARELELAAVRLLAQHVTVDLAAGPAESLFEPDPLAPEMKALRAARVPVPSSPSLPAVPAVTPNLPPTLPPTLPPQRPPLSARSPWTYAPALLLAGLLLGATGRLLAGNDADHPTEDVGQVKRIAPTAAQADATPQADAAERDESRLVPGLIAFVESGGMSAEKQHAIHSAIWKNRRAHAKCFIPYLKTQPNADGVLWLTASLGADGRVSDGWAEPESTIESDGLTDCLVAYLGDLALPAPPSPPLVVSIPFQLSGGQLAVPTPPSRVAARPR